MRTAILSDIHGNLAGLQAVLVDIDGQECNRVLCLGDLVDGGPQSAEVVRLIQERAILTVRGNHDEHPDTDLPPDIRAWRRDLPETLVEGETVYTHTSPRRRKAKIGDSVEAWNVFEETSPQRVFVGDIHVPLIFGRQCSEPVSAACYPIPYDEPFPFAPGDRYIVCVGAIGYSRDAYHWLRYAIFDTERDAVEFRAPAGPVLRF